MMKERGKLEMNVGEITKAIEAGWESLCFPSGTELARLEGPEGIVVLDVCGDVRIFDSKKQRAFVDEEIFENRPLMNAIKNGIYHNERYEILDNNWFCITFMDKYGGTIDDKVFESLPQSLKEVEEEMRNFYEYFTEEDE